MPSVYGEQWADVLLEEWVEGETLKCHIDRLAGASDRDALAQLSLKFDTFALELLAGEWAHGDITHENIIVTEQGELRLIDFDGMFTPELQGLQSCEVGTQSFQSPARTEAYFDRTIDDYPLALISSALSILALRPQFYTLYSLNEGLLFTPDKIIQGKCEALEASLDVLSMEGEIVAYNIAKLLMRNSVTLPQLYPLLHYKRHGSRPASAPTTIFCRQGLWGYLNDFEREVIPPLFDQAFSFYEGYAAILIGRYWHYINQYGQVAINCSKYQSIKDFHNGVGLALLDGQWVEVG